MSGENAKKIVTTAGSWISRVLLGDLRERIVEIDTTVRSIEKKVDAVEVRMDKMTSAGTQTALAVNEMQTVFRQRGVPLAQTLLIAPGSPLTLTDSGKELAHNSGVYSVMTEHRAVLVAAVKAKDLHSNYDIQECSRKVLEDFKDSPILANLKTYAYNNGLSLDGLLDLAGILLRDEVMKELKFEG